MDLSSPWIFLATHHDDSCIPTHGNDILNIQLCHTRYCNCLLSLCFIGNAFLLCTLGKNLHITHSSVSNRFDFYRMKSRGKHAFLSRILHGREILRINSFCHTSSLFNLQLPQYIISVILFCRFVSSLI